MTKTGLIKIDPVGSEPAGSRGIEVVPNIQLQAEKLKHDFSQANRFFDCLTGGTKEPVTFQTFSDCKNKQRPQIIHAKPNEKTFNRLQKINQKGSGIFVMVNEGDGKGRKGKNVVKVRDLFIDLDGAPWEPATKMLKPHIIVESSPGRYHLYWKVSDCTLERFKPLQQAIIKKFDGDKQCCDLPRVLRVPGFLHLKKQPCLTRLVEANDFPRYSTQQIVDGLGLSMDEPAAIAPPRTPQTATAAPVSKGHEWIDRSGEVHDLTPWAARNPQFDIVGNFNKQFARGEIKTDGKQHIVCPFAHEHTDTNPDFSTFIVNAHLPEYPAFDIHCMHSHCDGRDRLAFLAAMFDAGMLSPEILQTPALQMRKPPYANYPAQVIAETLQLRTLKPDEFRIVLHLMHLSFLEDDGTLTDDNWMIARSLGLDEKEWQAYRDTLSKTGWLMIADDRLFSPIFRREFIKAQLALMNKIKGGSNGGKKAAANKGGIP